MLTKKNYTGTFEIAIYGGKMNKINGKYEILFRVLSTNCSSRRSGKDKKLVNDTRELLDEVKAMRKALRQSRKIPLQVSEKAYEPA